MLVVQSKDTFIRTKQDVGYIYNQKTKLERLYNETGIDYLNAINRYPKDITEIVNDILLPLFYDVSFDEIYNDFYSFLNNLEIEGFVFLGNNYEELKRKEANFNSTLRNFSIDNIPKVYTDSQNAILDMVGKQPYLMSLQFELTSKCNERCIHCYIPNEKKDKGIDLPINMFKKVMNEFYKMGGLQVSLSGGEIFMHKNILDIIKFCREKDMQIILLTNLISINEDLIPFLKEINLSMIQASLYSMKEEIHDKITKIQGSYKKTRKAIELLVKNDIPVMISCPIMKANSECYHDILEYAHTLGIKAQTDFILMGEENMSNENLKNRIDLNATEKVIREILHNEGVDSVDHIKDLTPVELFQLKLSQPVCAAGITNICINANGDVTPCNGWQGLKAGNIYKSSLKDIWSNSENLNKLRKITRGSFRECLGCSAKEFCSLCMARNYNESNGNYLKINPELCKIAFLNKRIYEEMSIN